MRGLIVHDRYLSKILAGKKAWELRGRRTNVRGRIALIRGGSGLVVGSCEIVDVIGPLSLAQAKRNAKTKLDEDARGWTSLRYAETYAWVLAKPKTLKRPVKYAHPRGAVIWVTLDAKTSAKIWPE